MLVAPEVPALQPRLLAPVDLLPHRPDLVLGDLHLHDDDEPPPPPEDGWVQGMKTFFVVSECFPNQDGQGIGDDDFSLVPKSAADVLWHHLHSSPEAVMSANGLPVQHALRLHLC